MSGRNGEKYSDTNEHEYTGTEEYGIQDTEYRS